VECVEDRAHVADSITARAYTGGTSKRKGFLWELVSGHSLSVALGRFVEKMRLVDRKDDRYKERVVDPVTGEVLRDVDEPLSEHRGQGSAKRGDP
jgi:hypothetical protein